jgi:hypothetical protein
MKNVKGTAYIKFIMLNCNICLEVIGDRETCVY